jgi:hypothetical protein
MVHASPERPYAISHQPFAMMLLVLLVALWSTATPNAHDIPADVTIQTFFKADGERLRLVVRVPLAAMRDLDYPKRGPRGSELLDLARADATLNDAATLWVGDFVDVYENDEKLPYPRVASTRASLPSDTSFASYDEALAHVTGPKLPDDTEFVWTQGLLDILFEYQIRSDRSRFSINPRFARLGIRTRTVLRFLPAGGSTITLGAPSPRLRAFEFEGDPGVVRLDPSWYQAGGAFVERGFEHFLGGTDYLLFLACLVLPLRRVRSLVAVVTAFAIAHSITLIASANNFAPDALWFPPLIETLIATSIVYMALENVFDSTRGPARAAEGPLLAPEIALKRRWLVAFGFGLVYGFGFSFALRRTLQFAGTHLLTSVLSFNAGVELGQLVVLGLLVPALALVFGYLVDARTGTIILSVLAAHTAWHWMAERWDVLRRFRFEWPALDLAFWASAMRWAMLLVAAAGLYWLVFSVLQRPADPPMARAEKDL